MARMVRNDTVGCCLKRLFSVIVSVLSTDGYEMLIDESTTSFFHSSSPPHILRLLAARVAL